MRWKSQDIKKLRGIKVGEVLELTYQALFPLPKIDAIKPSCGCTDAVYDKEKQQLTAIYKGEKIPKHLKDQGYFLATKHITISYIGATPDRLTFTIKVIDDGISV